MKRRSTLHGKTDLTFTSGIRDSDYDKVLAVANHMGEITGVSLRLEDIHNLQPHLDRISRTVTALETVENLSARLVVLDSDETARADLVGDEIVIQIPKPRDGVDGIRGPEGPRGFRGLAGLDGAKGDKGDKGEKGDRGPIGPIGPKGEKGDNGENAIVTGITTLPDGRLVLTFNNSGSFTTESLKGDKGDKGDQGDEGPKGPPGDDIDHVSFVDTTTDSHGNLIHLTAGQPGAVDTYDVFGDSLGHNKLGTFKIRNGSNIGLTPAEVAGVYESNSDTNKYTDADRDAVSSLSRTIQSAVDDIVDNAPSALNTLNKISRSIGNDENFATTVNTLLSRKVNTATYTASDVKAKYESNSNTNPFTDAERDKLKAVVLDSTAKDNANRNRANHTGTQSIETITESTAHKVMTAAERTKLSKVPNDTSSELTSISSKLSSNDSSLNDLQDLVDYSKSIKSKVDSLTMDDIDETTLTKKLTSAERTDIANAKSKLSGIEDNATGDQTASEIKSLYESNSDTNAFTDNDKSLVATALQRHQDISGKADKSQVLTDVPSNAVFTDTTYSNADIKTMYEANNDTNAFTDAEKAKLGNALTSHQDLSGYVRSNRVLTDVPANAVFTDTTYDAQTIKSLYESNDDVHALTQAQVNDISHANRAVLDRFGTDASGNLTFDNHVPQVTVAPRDVVNNLTSDDATLALSAKQGKALKTLIDTKAELNGNPTEKFEVANATTALHALNKRTGSSLYSSKSHNHDALYLGKTATASNSDKLSNKELGTDIPVMKGLSTDGTHAKKLSTESLDDIDTNSIYYVAANNTTAPEVTLSTSTDTSTEHIPGYVKTMIVLDSDGDKIGTQVFYSSVEGVEKIWTRTLRKELSLSSASWSSWSAYVTEDSLTDTLSTYVAANSLQLGGIDASNYALVKEKIPSVYVSSDPSIGDDSNRGSDRSHPKLTIKAAIESVESGDRAAIILLPTSGHDTFEISSAIESSNTNIVIHAAGAEINVTNNGGFTMYGGYLWLKDGVYNVHVTPFIKVYEDARVNLSSGSQIDINIFVNNFELLYNRSSQGSSINYITTNNLHLIYGDPAYSNGRMCDIDAGSIVYGKHTSLRFPAGFDNNTAELLDPERFAHKAGDVNQKFDVANADSGQGLSSSAALNKTTADKYYMKKTYSDDGKVDTVPGKGLSTNDYTNNDKRIVEASGKITSLENIPLWDTADTYNLNDIITYDARTYISVVPSNQGNKPRFDVMESKEIVNFYDEPGSGKVSIEGTTVISDISGKSWDTIISEIENYSGLGVNPTVSVYGRFIHVGKQGTTDIVSTAGTTNDLGFSSKEHGPINSIYWREITTVSNSLNESRTDVKYLGIDDTARNAATLRGLTPDAFSASNHTHTGVSCSLMVWQLIVLN